MSVPQKTVKGKMLPRFLTGVGYSLAFLVVILAVVSTLVHLSGQEFSHLAWAFLHGKPYFITDLAFNGDMVIHNGHWYWHMPPFPALILMPMSALALRIVDLSFVMILGNIFLAVLLYLFLRRKFLFDPSAAFWLTLAYMCSGVYIVSLFIPWAYYYAHMVATILIFLSFFEFFGRRRYWLIGLLLGCVFLTRFTAALTVLFYIFFILGEPAVLRHKIRGLIALCLPLVIGALFLVGYNYVRFGDWTTTGYTQNYNYTKSKGPTDDWGLFNIHYIPTNIYYYFFASAAPVQISTSNDDAYLLAPPFMKGGYLNFFLTAPIFLFLFFSRINFSRVSRYALATAGIIFFVLLTYYYTGTPQVGPRYFNDFLPLLFLGLIEVFKKQGVLARAQLLIITSTILNVYFLYTVYFH